MRQMRERREERGERREERGERREERGERRYQSSIDDEGWGGGKESQSKI
jgi:hypothetical protein